MKFSETGFRAIYHQFVVFPLMKVTRSAAQDFPGMEAADGVLAYGYYDREAGLTLEVLACARRNDDSWRFANSNDEIRSFIRMDAVKDEIFCVIRDKGDSLRKRYAAKIEVLKAYDPDEAVEKSRSFAFLDQVRDPVFIDDVLVFLEKKDLKPEGCWARIIDVTENRLWAKLLNEPDQDFGIHRGEDFTFYVHEDERTGRITCHAQFSAIRKIDPETLEDGSRLKEAVRVFHEGTDQDALFMILQILRDSHVWIPCSAVIGEEDQRAMEKRIEEAGDDPDSMIGETFTSRGQIRLVPDILEKDGKYFFPVFSTEEDLGEYGEDVSKIQEHFLTVIDLARNNEHEGKELTGIVINPFTAPFILPKELYEGVEKMPSRVEE